MKPEDHPSKTPDLHSRAEAAFQAKTASFPENLEELSPEVTRTLLRELRVRQIELEMQNDELRREQADLDGSRARYFDLYDVAPVGYVTVSEPGMILQSNLTAAALLGTTQSELVTQPFTRFIHEEDAGSYSRLRSKLLATGAAQTCKLRLVTGDGTLFPALVAATAAQDESGTRILRLTLSDNTAYQQAEAALWESQQQMKLVLQDANIGVWNWDLKTDRVDYSREWKSQLGYEPNEIGDRLDEWLNRLHPDDIALALARHRQFIEQPWPDFELEFRLRHRDGSWRWILSRATRVNDATGQAERLTGIHVDITVRKQAEAALAASQAAVREANENLRRSNEELEHRVVVRTAQLRTLATELTHAEERERLRIADTLHEGLLQQLAAASIHLSNLKQQISKGATPSSLGSLQSCLDEAINVGRTLTHELFPPALQSLGLGAALAWLGQWHQEKYGLLVEVEAAPEIDVEEMELRITLFRAANELLLNVHKHANVRQARLVLRRVPGGAVRLVVSDAGAGFDTAAVRAREGPRGGFGLFSLRERVETLGGLFHVRSVPGHGSRVTVIVASRDRSTVDAPEASGTKSRMQPADTSSRATKAPVKQAKPALPASPTDLARMSAEEIEKLVHKLHVHQIELEMQNEELRRAQVELDISRARYFDLYDLAPVGYVTVSKPGLILQANLTAATILGMEQRDLIDQPLSRFILENDADTHPLLRRQDLAADEPQTSELRMVKNDGTSFWAHLAATAAQDEKGTPILRLTLSDITDRKDAEAALRESEEKFRTLFETASDAIFLMQGDQFIDCNARTLEMFGCRTRDQIVGHPPYEFSPPVQPNGRASQESAIEKITAALHGRPQFFEWLHTKFDGTPFPAEVSLNTVKLGDKVLLQAIVRDITDRKQAEESLRVASQKLRLHFEQTPIGVIEWDMEFRVVRWNPAATTIFGFSRDAAVGQHGTFIIPGAFRQHVEDIWQALLTQSGGERSSNENVREDGEIILCEWYNTPLIDEQGTVGGVASLVMDITERRQAQIERERLERKMQEAQKLESLGVLAGGIAHDFNNILTGILGNASLASLELPPGSPLHSHLESINEGSLRAADLCKQMLAYSGRGRFVIQRLHLGQLVEETAQMLKISISKKAELRFHLENGLPPVDADATQIRQVIMNLVINASEAIGDKSGVITLTTGLAHVDRAYLGGTLLAPELPEGEYVFLEVSDDGCGMNAETQARIFDPFFTTKFTGRGLGLAAVLGIVRGHNGALKVESEPGRGTTFKILLPSRSNSDEVPPAHPDSSAGLWRGRGTVLVVDDEDPVRAIAARMLPHTGFDFVLVSDGREAVEVFRADPHRFALVLLDLTMPHMGGEETFAELRRLRADVPVVLMSGYDQQEALVRFPSKGLASFLQKPFTTNELRAVLQTALG